MRWLWFVIALTGCIRASLTVCDDGLACPRDYVCDPTGHGCLLPDQLVSCGSLTDGTMCQVRDPDDGLCAGGICREKRCGDGFVTTGEQCDGVAASTLTCQNFGFYDAVQPPCNATCEYNLAMCTGYCGDGAVTGPEICESTIAPTRTCLDYGFGAGPLRCASCGPETSDCERLAWEASDVATNLAGIHGLADDDIYGVADGVYHFDGTAWSQLDLGACDGSSLRYVYEPQPGVVFAAPGSSGGNLGRVLRISNGVCTSYQTANGSSISGLFALSATDAWAISETNGFWHFNGTDWTQVDTRAARSIHGFASNDIYAAIASQPNSFLHWNGTAWSPVPGYPSTTLPTLRVIFGASSTDMYLAGTNGATPTVLHYNGASFTQVSFGAYPIVNVVAGVSVGTRTVLQGTSGVLGAIVLEYDGSSWADLHTPSANATTAFWVSPRGTVYTGFAGGARVLRLENLLVRMPAVWSGGLASSIEAAAQNDVLLATPAGVQHFDGTTWTAVSPVSTFFDTAKDSDGNMFAISNQAGLLRPVAAGAWTIDATPKGHFLAAVAPNDLWIVDSFSRSVTRWLAGVTSSPPSITGLLAANENLTGIWGTSPANVYAGSNLGNVFRFNGITWSLAWTSPDSVYKIWGPSATSVYAASATGTLQHFDGTTVTTTKLGNQIAAIYGTADNDLFVATDQAVMHFDGTQWAPTAIGGPQLVFSAAGVGDSVFFGDFGRGVSLLVRTKSWVH